MNFIQKPKGNNFSPPLTRFDKVEQKSPSTVPLNLSLKQDPIKLNTPQRDRLTYCKRLSPLTSKETVHKASRQNDESSKQNPKKEHRQNNNYILSPESNKIEPSPLDRLYLPIPLSTNILTNNEKARMIRELNLKIELLESKSKQPGLCLEDLVPLREEIYNKIDQYYITGHQTRSRFIDTQQSAIQNHKITARQSRARKPSKEIDEVYLKLNSKIYSPSSSVSHKSSSKEKPKPISSKLVPPYEQDQAFNRKTYKTMENIELLSPTNRSNNEQEEQQRPVFEVQLSEKEFLDLDRDPERRMSECEEEHHQSYIELKENVRIMEQRIGFLIHRLEENKKEITSLREGKEKIEKSWAQQQKIKGQISEELLHLSNLYKSLQAEYKKLKEQYEEKQKRNCFLEKQILRLEKSIDQLNSQVQYLTQRLKTNQNQMGSLQQLLLQKKSEHQDIYHTLLSLEKDFAKKRIELIEQIQEKDNELHELKGQLKEQKARMEVEGINFKFEEATKLKKYIEQNELLHQREIQKLDSTYSSVINNYESENRRIKNEKIQLENALIEFLGGSEPWNKSPKQQKGQQYTSDLIKLSAVELQLGDFSGNQISGQLIFLLQKLSKIEKQRNEQIAERQRLENRFSILKDEYQSIIDKKCSQIDSLLIKITQAANLNQSINRQKQELHDELASLRQKNKQNALFTHKIRNIDFNQQIIQFRYPQPQLTLVDNGTTFQKIMDKMTKVPLKRKLQIALKLIDLALTFAGKKRLPSLNPTLLTVQFAEFSNDFSIEINKTAKEDDDQNLHYCSPEVLLGFNETHQSHCWTIGVILDRLIHGKEYFNQYSQIISRKQNYSIRDQKYKKLQFLNDMLRKNQKQRIGLEEVRQKITHFLAISHLQ